MEWTTDLSVGVELIDEQHQELFRRISALLESIRKKECKFVIDPTYAFLDEYVRSHFSEEEGIMRSTQYPDYPAHKKEHESFIANFEKLKDELKNEPSSYTRSVYTNQIVVDWIISHIKRVDRKLGAFLSSRK